MFKYNPITYIKDIIDLVRRPPGEVSHAREITPENIEQVKSIMDPSAAPYIQLGDYVVSFEDRGDFLSICPRAEFQKSYFFAFTPNDPADVDLMRVVAYPNRTQ